MKIETERIPISSKGKTDIHDITPKLNQIVASSGTHNGQLTVFNPGSTAGISMIEYEPGLLEDIPQLMEKLIPSGVSYNHDQTWHDGNGHSHLRAFMIGPSMTIPYVDGKLTLGTWQQIILVDFDVRPRQRELVVQLIGE